MNNMRQPEQMELELNIPPVIKKPKVPLEKDVEARLRRKIKAIGGISWKFNSMNNRGVSDRIVLYKGRVVFVEVKREGGKLSKLQAHFKQEVLSNGSEFACVSGYQGVDAFIQQLEKDALSSVSLFTGAWAIIKRFTQ